MINKRIENLLSLIILHAPALGYITGGWQAVHENPNTPTLATDGNNLYYNNEYINSLSDEELGAVLIHEITHCMLLHPWKLAHIEQKNKDLHAWEIAQEIVTNAITIDIINQTKLNMKLPGSPFSPLDKKQKILPNTTYYFYDPVGHNHTTEEIYQMLPKNYEYITKEIHQFPTVNDVLPNLDKNKEQEQIERTIATVEKLQKSIGSLPSGLARLLQKLTYGRIPWQRILHNFMSSVTRKMDDIRWESPNYKHPLANEIIVPGEVSEELNPIIIAIDTSGSISEENLTEFASEINSLIRYTQEVTLVTTDAQIHEVVKVQLASELIKKLKFKGGGGTNFIPFFEKFKNASAVIFFTDGYATYPQKPPKYPVLWILTKDHQKPPFGKVAYIIN